MLLYISGCAVALVGVGAGAGAVAYVQGKLIRKYNHEYHQTIQASIDTLNALKIQVADEIGDELKTTINATRPDGTPVRIDIVRIEPDLTEVGVRTGTVGLSNREVSEQIQGFIQQRLSRTYHSPAPPTEAQTNNDSTSAIQAPPEDKNAATKSMPTQEHDLSAVPAATKNQSGPNNRILSGDQSDQTSPAKAIRLFFGPNSNELSDQQIEQLDAMTGFILENPTARVYINGYSDSSGSREYNKMVSESRANAVKAYLLAKGVDTGKMEAIGHGAKKFIAGNDTEEGRRLNRRVEIDIFILKNN